MFRGFLGAAYVPYTFQSYQNYTALYHENPNRDIFANDPAGKIYNPQSQIRQTFGRALLPREYREDRLTPEQQDALRARGMKNIARFSELTMTANVARLIGDTASVGKECFSETGSCERSKTSVNVLDMGSTAFWLGAQAYAKLGGDTLAGTGEKIEERAYLLFKNGQQLMFVQNVFQLSTGGVKMYIEADHFIHHRKEASLSAFVDGAVDAGRGGTYAIYNLFLLREAAKVAKLGRLKQATDTLAVWAMPIPRPLLMSMRALGMLGAGISVATNVYSIYDGATNEAITEQQGTHQILSGSLGTVSSLFFLGAAFFITPASIPIGVALFCAGSALLVAQTIYDLWNTVKRKGIS